MAKSLFWIVAGVVCGSIIGFIMPGLGLLILFIGSMFSCFGFLWLPSDVGPLLHYALLLGAIAAPAPGLNGGVGVIQGRWFPNRKKLVSVLPVLIVAVALAGLAVCLMESIFKIGIPMPFDWDDVKSGRIPLGLGFAIMVAILAKVTGYSGCMVGRWSRTKSPTSEPGQIC